MQMDLDLSPFCISEFDFLKSQLDGTAVSPRPRGALGRQQASATPHAGMSRQLAVAGLGVGVAAAACLLGRGPGPVMIPASPAPAAEPSSAAAAAAAAAADGAAGRRTRSRFRTHQGAETAVVGCSTGKEYLSCVDHFVGRGDSVLIIRGTTDGTADKDSTAKADQER